jgi:stage III sporulation protein AB
MIKLVGSLCVLGGGVMVVWQRHLERRHQGEVLRDLVHALGYMAEEIRMARTPLPQLLERLAADCGRTMCRFFLQAAKATRNGEGLTEVWRQEAERLPLGEEEKELLKRVNLQGDEEKICKELLLVTKRLTMCLEERMRKAPEETKRTSALCFSAAALLVILLI